MRHLPLGPHRYVPKQYIFETMNAKVPYHNIKSMVGSGAKKKDVGSMKPISLEVEGEGIRKMHRTIQPLRFRM
jgi:hypothetical protein